jgi:flavin-dependent dehydrogenase
VPSERADADVVVAGGGPAGLSTALHLLACAPRLRVVVLEPYAYPRDKICAGAIAARAFTQLAQIDVRMPLPGVPSLRIDAFEVAIGGALVRAVEPDAARVVRRLAFDAALASVARARGVVVREGLRLVGVLRRDDGLELACADGSDCMLTLSTRVLVGADGVTGITRRLAGFPRHGALRAQAIEVDTPRVASDAPDHTLRFSFLPQLRGYVWDFPTPLDGKIMVSRGAYLLRDRREQPDNVRAHLAHHLAEHDLSLADFEPRQLAEQGFAPHAPLATPRILLVGEAAGIDFPTGEGIAQAIAYGAIAAPYLAHALAHDQLGFVDWPRTWLSSDEGRFLRRRALGGRVMFGPQREHIERALGASPAVFALVLRRFAGRPTTRLAVARALYELARAGLRDHIA